MPRRSFQIQSLVPWRTGTPAWPRCTQHSPAVTVALGTGCIRAVEAPESGITVATVGPDLSVPATVPARSPVRAPVTPSVTSPNATPVTQPVTTVYAETISTRFPHLSLSGLLLVERARLPMRPGALLTSRIGYLLDNNNSEHNWVQQQQ